VATLAGRLADLAAILGYDWKDHEQRIVALEAQVLPAKPTVQVVRSTTLALTNATETTVGYDTEIADDLGFHSNITNNHRLTVPAGAGGLYYADMECWYQSNATNSRYTRIYRRNAANVIQDTISDIRNGSAGGVGTIVHLGAPLRLTPGDIVDSSQYQNSTAALTTPANTIRLALYRLSN
jgi:hypothetical protein